MNAKTQHYLSAMGVALLIVIVAACITLGAVHVFGDDHMTMRVAQQAAGADAAVQHGTIIGTVRSVSEHPTYPGRIIATVGVQFRRDADELELPRVSSTIPVAVGHRVIVAIDGGDLRRPKRIVGLATPALAQTLTVRGKAVGSSWFPTSATGRSSGQAAAAIRGAMPGSPGVSTADIGAALATITSAPGFSGAVRYFQAANDAPLVVREHEGSDVFDITAPTQQVMLEITTPALVAWGQTIRPVARSGSDYRARNAAGSVLVNQADSMDVLDADANITDEWYVGGAKSVTWRYLVRMVAEDGTRIPLVNGRIRSWSAGTSIAHTLRGNDSGQIEFEAETIQTPTVVVGVGRIGQQVRLEVEMTPYFSQISDASTTISGSTVVELSPWSVSLTEMGIPSGLQPAPAS